MPLTNGHVNYISRAIEHFFYDLASGPLEDPIENLSNKIVYFSSIFEDAFARDPSQPARNQVPGETNEAYEFFLCATDPQTALTGLEHEDKNQNFTVAEVQQAIFDYAASQFEKSLKQIDPEITGVIPEVLGKNLIPNPANNQKIFTSTVPPADHGFFGYAFDLPEDSNRIFHAEIRQRFFSIPNSFTFINMDLHITLNLPDRIFEHVITDFIFVPDLRPRALFRKPNETEEIFKRRQARALLQEKENEKNFKIEAEKKAQELAEEKAIEFALEYFNGKRAREEGGASPAVPNSAIQAGAAPAFSDAAWSEALPSVSPILQRTSRLASPSNVPPPLPPRPSRPHFFQAVADRLKPGRKLLTYTYYLNAVDTRQIGLDELMEFSPTNVMQFTSPAIITLMREGLCDFNSASQLRSYEIKVLENRFYLQKSLDRQISYSEFTGLSEQQAKILNLPSIVNLQEKKPDISIAEIKKISLPAAFLFADEHWKQFVIEGKVNFYDLQQITEAERKVLRKDEIISQLFSVPAISALILRIITAPEYSFLRSQRFLNIDTIKNISAEGAENLLLPNMNLLIAKGHITLEQAITMPHKNLKRLAYFHTLIENITNKRDPENLVADFNSFCEREKLSKTPILAKTIKRLLQNMEIQVPITYTYLPDKITSIENRAKRAKSSTEADDIWIEGLKKITDTCRKMQSQTQARSYMGGVSSSSLAASLYFFERGYTPDFFKEIFYYEKIINQLHFTPEVARPRAG